jgi:hypothetical protein
MSFMANAKEREQVGAALTKSTSVPVMVHVRLEPARPSQRIHG